MGVFAGPEINEDGLVLALDAGNTKSYPGSGSTWTDLSGNGNDGTINGATHTSGTGGYFDFDGSNDYVSFSSYSQPAYSSSSTFTWSVWLYPVSNSNNPIIGNRGTDLNFTKLTSNNFEYYSDNFGGAMTLNEWQNICITKNGTSFTYYKNGSSIATQTSSITKPSKPFFIGGDNTAAEYSNHRISMAMVYTAALTASEVAQNFNALRGRYGI
tara:strand:- start:818 stop:1456 length:639 start_codon:yes stop_codon:yes gene_type:complete